MFGLLFIVMLCLLCGLYFYFYKCFQRFLSLFALTKKKIKILSIIGIILAIFLSMNIWGVGAIVFLHFTMISFIIDFLFFIVKKSTGKELKKIQASLLIPSILTIAIFIYAYNNMTNVVLTKYEINTSKKISQDYKILYISDLHWKTTISEPKLKKIIEKINQEHYDFAILGGDIVDENTSNDEMINIFKNLGNIKTKDGIYFVYGNHDLQPYTNHKTFTSQELEDILVTNHIKSLKDDKVIINDDIILYGRLDYSLNPERQKSDVFIKQLDKQKFLIVADHQPLDVSINARAGYDLQVSGHTHGGQIFPVKQFIELFLNQIAYGHQKKDNFDIIVSSGFGGWAYPLRTSEHSEYVTIELKRA